MDIKDALELYQSQYEIVDTIWGYYSAITLAILGYTIGTQRSTQKLLEFRAIQAGYFVFAVGNLIALTYAQMDLFSLSGYVNALGKAENPQIVISPVNIYLLAIFHLFVTFAVIIGLNYVYKSRNQ